MSTEELERRFNYKPYVDYIGLLDELECAIRNDNKEMVNVLMRFVGGRIPLLLFVEHQREQMKYKAGFKRILSASNFLK